MTTDLVLMQIHQIETAMLGTQHRLHDYAQRPGKAWDGYTYLIQHWRQLDDKLITNKLTQHMPRGLKTWARKEAWKIPAYMRRLRKLEKEP